MALRSNMIFAGSAAIIFLVSCTAQHTPEYSYRIVHAYPHDPTAFTQGLEYKAGCFYESTGLKGHSTLRKVKPETGEIIQQATVPPEYFAEGITVLDHQILQLTWQSHVGFIYDQPAFHLLRTFTYPGEGWGLTNDGETVYMSDGTPQIRCWNAVTLAETKRFTVHDGSLAIENLNELEYVRGEIYANVWQTDRIARISPADGRVLGWIDLSGLLSMEDRLKNPDVLNGIAYDPVGDRLFITGKLWPKLFEIKLVPKP
jgi:glutaminyl-peptide cyclotransferase